MVTTTERPETIDERELRQSRDYFLQQVTEHEMTVLLDTLDDGTSYRHVRFAKPGTTIWSWSLITWPGHLAISGDLQDHVFCRIPDMFDFFGRGSLDPGYWGEKLTAEGTSTDHGRTRYSQEKFKQRVEEELRWALDDRCARCRRDLHNKAMTELLVSPPEYIEDAWDVLDSFHWEPPVNTGGGSCMADQEFAFYDVGGWDLTGWDWHFLLALHAVQFGVQRYLKEFPGRVIPER